LTLAPAAAAVQLRFTSDEPEKKSKSGMVVKKVHVAARKSQRREAYCCAPERFRDAAQRRNLTFCGAITFERG
jgi:hypothetical protein